MAVLVSLMREWVSCDDEVLRVDRPSCPALLRPRLGWLHLSAHRVESVASGRYFSGVHSDLRARQNHDDAFHGDDTRDAEWGHRAGLTQY